MASTTLKAIIDRIEVVCESVTVGLSKSLTPFSLEREPSSTVESAYYIEDAGLSESVSGTSDTEYRIDRLTVWIASRLMFTGQTQVETMQTLLNTIERQIIADGPAQGYHAMIAGRLGPRPLGANDDVCVSGLTMLVDYDYSTV